MPLPQTQTITLRQLRDRINELAEHSGDGILDTPVRAWTPGSRWDLGLPFLNLNGRGGPVALLEGNLAE